MQSRLKVLALATAVAMRAGAQAPESGPLVLRLPASTRATALGNAWVTSRDEDAIFYNPAQLINPRAGFGVSLGRYGGAGTIGSIASGYAAGPLSLSLGWGVQIASFDVDASVPYPYVPATLLTRGSNDVTSLQAVGGAAIVYKGFRIGAAGKYATDLRQNESQRGLFLGDVGLSRSLLNGVAAISVQNIGHGLYDGDHYVKAPFQGAIGYTLQKNTDQLDIGLVAQVTGRTGWISPAGGVELAYGWIEGWSAALRVGAHRPETNAERPVALGATLNADHLTLDYALQFFDGGKHVNRVTIRWR